MLRIQILKNELSSLSKPHFIEFCTYDCVLELLNGAAVLSDLLVVLVGRDGGNSDSYSPICLLQGYVDLLLELFHVQTRLHLVLH